MKIIYLLIATILLLLTCALLGMAFAPSGWNPDSCIGKTVKQVDQIIGENGVYLDEKGLVLWQKELPLLLITFQIVVDKDKEGQLVAIHASRKNKLEIFGISIAERSVSSGEPEEHQSHLRVLGFDI